MAEKGSTTRRSRVHAREKDFTLYVRKRGLFTLLAVQGWRSWRRDLEPATA